jgi:hypothetical protein
VQSDPFAQGACAHVPILRFAFSSVKVVRHIKQIFFCGKDWGGHAGVIKKWSIPVPATIHPKKIGHGFSRTGTDPNLLKIRVIRG